MTNRSFRHGLAPSLVLFAATALGGCGHAAAGPAAAPPPPTVSVAVVPFRTLADWHDYTGSIEAVQRVSVRPRVAGFVEAVHFTEGALVKQGQLLYQIDPRPLAAQVARLRAEAARADAQSRLADAGRARGATLLAQEAVSVEENERLAAAATTARAEVGAARAALHAAELELSFTRVTAPISGRVSRALITAGNLVDAQSELTTLVSVDPVYVAFDVDEATYLASQSDPARGKVFVGRMTDEGTPREAQLTFVDNASHNGVIRLRATLPNRDGAFTPGLFARVRLVAGREASVALVDDRAIGTDLGKQFVLAVSPRSVAEYRAVTTGARVDGLRVVREGLHPGDRVIVNGLQRAKPGTPVTPRVVPMVEAAPALAQLGAPAAADPTAAPAAPAH